MAKIETTLRLEQRRWVRAAVPVLGVCYALVGYVSDRAADRVLGLGALVIAKFSFRYIAD